MTIEIEYEAEKKLDLPYEKIIRDVIEEAMDYEGCPYEAEVSVVLTDNPSIQEINRDYRQIDRPTDVLSFPMVDYERPADFCGLEEQAEKYGHSQARDLAFLVAHSMLHLFGYDHMEEEERLVMERKQAEILERRGYRR